MVGITKGNVKPGNKPLAFRGTVKPPPILHCPASRGRRADHEKLWSVMESNNAVCIDSRYGFEAYETGTTPAAAGPKNVTRYDTLKTIHHSLCYTIYGV